LVIETHGSKLSNIAISFYHNIVHENVWCDMGLWELEVLYSVWNEINIFQIRDKNLNYALNHQCNIL